MAGWDFDGPLRIAHYDYWLVSPIPTPHASTIRAANPAPRPGADGLRVPSEGRAVNILEEIDAKLTAPE